MDPDPPPPAPTLEELLRRFERTRQHFLALKAEYERILAEVEERRPAGRRGPS
jgi:hypothetical protein